jgi:hypothetical protein
VTQSSSQPELLFKGLVLSFFKRLNSRFYKIDKENFDYDVWGYFDGLTVDQVEEGLEKYFSVDYTGKNINKENYDIDRLCLYFETVSGNIPDILNNSWKRETYPVIYITALKFPNGDRFSKTELITTIRQMVTEKIEELNLAQDIIFKTFFSLGYSDLVIIFRTNQHSKRIISLLSRLKNKKIIKYSYTIPGLVSGVRKNQEKPILLDLQIRASLKTEEDSLGYSGILSKIHDRLFSIDENAKIISTLGKYDLELDLSSVEINNIKNLFSHSSHLQGEHKFQNIFHPSNKFFQKNIRFTNTKWFVGIDDLIKNESYQCNNPRTTVHSVHDIDRITRNTEASKLKEEIIKQKSIIEKYKAVKEKTNTIELLSTHEKIKFPDSILEMLKRLAELNNQICNSDDLDDISSKDLWEINHTFFDLIIESLETIEKNIKDSCNTVKRELLCPETHSIVDKINEVKKDIIEGIENISHYTQNRFQANNIIFEASSAKLYDITALSKIFYIYANIIESVEGSLRLIKGNEKAKSSINSKINYFPYYTVSEFIGSKILFQHSHPVPDTRLIPIEMDFTTFWDIKTSIPFIIHEMGHYIRPYDRQKRNEIFAKIIAFDFSRFIVLYMLFPDFSSSFALSNEIVTALQRLIGLSIKENEVALQEDSIGISNVLFSVFTEMEINDQIDILDSFSEKYFDNLIELFDFTEMIKYDAYKFKQQINSVLVDYTNEKEGSRLLLLCEEFINKIDEKSLRKGINIDYFLNQFSNELGSCPNIQENQKRNLSNAWKSLIENLDNVLNDQLEINKFHSLEKKLHLDKIFAEINKVIFDELQNNSSSYKAWQIELILDGLTKYGLNENSKTSRNQIFKKILVQMNNIENQTKLIDNMVFYQKLFKEATADFYMLLLLDLNDNIENYKYIINNYPVSFRWNGNYPSELQCRVYIMKEVFRWDLTGKNETALFKGMENYLKIICMQIADFLKIERENSDLKQILIDSGKSAFVQSYCEAFCNKSSSNEPQDSQHLQPIHNLHNELSLIHKVWIED